MSSARSTRAAFGPAASPWLGLPFLVVGLVVGMVAVALANAPAGAVPQVGPLAAGLFGFIFSAAGSGILFGGLAFRAQQRRRASALDEDPRRPWRAEGRWQGLETRSASGWALLKQWMMAVYVLAFLSLFLVLALSPSTPTFMRVIVGLFSLVGVAVVLSALYRTLQRWKWGRARMTFRRVPVAPGERLEGMIFCGRRIEPRDGFQLVLLCAEDRVERRRVGNKTSVSYQRHDLFEKELRVENDLLSALAAEGTAIPVDLLVPADHPPTSMPSTGEIYWELEVRAKTRGIDFAATFPLPVYAYADEALVERRV